MYKNQSAYYNVIYQVIAIVDKTRINHNSRSTNNINETEIYNNH